MERQIGTSGEQVTIIRQKGIISSFFGFIFDIFSFFFRNIFKYKILTILFIAFIVILSYGVLLSTMFL